MRFLLPLLAILTAVALPVRAQQDEPVVQILNKTEKQVEKDGVMCAVLDTTSPSRYRVGGTRVLYGDGALQAYIFTEWIPATEVRNLAVRVGEHIFPGPVGVEFGNGEFALGVGGLDDQSLLILRGETPGLPVQKQLSLEWQPIQGKAGQVVFSISNIGRTPLTLSYGMPQTDEGPARDPQLVFTATRDGKPVAASSRLLPLGAWSPPERLAPGELWERIVNLNDYLSLAEAGRYEVKAHYTMRVHNLDAQATGSPASWNVGFDGAFDIGSTPRGR